MEDAAKAPEIGPQDVGPKAATAADIEAADDRKRRLLKVPEWGGLVVYILSWSGQELMDFEQETQKLADEIGEDEALGLYRARLAAWSLCDENDRPLFQRNLADYRRLQKKGAKPLLRIRNVVHELNALGDEADEDVEKN